MQNPGDRIGRGDAACSNHSTLHNLIRLSAHRRRNWRIRAIPVFTYGIITTSKGAARRNALFIEATALEGRSSAPATPLPDDLAQKQNDRGRCDQKREIRWPEGGEIENPS